MKVQRLGLVRVARGFRIEGRILAGDGKSLGSCSVITGPYTSLPMLPLRSCTLAPPTRMSPLVTSVSPQHFSDGGEEKAQALFNAHPNEREPSEPSKQTL